MKKLFDIIQKKFSKEEVSKIYIKRPMRIKILPQHKLLFITNKNVPSLNYTIENISATGIAFVANSNTTPINKTDLIQGQLIIDNDVFDIVVEIMHVSSNFIGCKFIKTPAHFKAKLSYYFYHELLASTLYSIKSDKLNVDPDGDQVFLMGEDNCELYYVKQENKLIKFNLTIMGNYIEVDKNKNFFFGNIVEDESSEGLNKYKGSSLIQKDPSYNLEVKNNIIKFINNVDELPQNFRNEMVELIKASA